MEVSQLWTSVQEIQKSVSVINGELGKTMTDVVWLKQSFWELMSYVRIITGGVIVGVILSIWNIMVVKKNNHKR